MTFDPSNDLSAEARALLDAASDGDAPTSADRVRVRAGVARRLALGIAAGAVVATTAKSAAAGAAAASGSALGASSGTGVAGAVGATSIAGGSIAAGASTAATGTAVAAGGTALTGGALTFGIAGAGGKFLAAIAIVGAVGATTVTYRELRSSPSALVTTSASAGQTSDRAEAIAKPAPRRTSTSPLTAPNDAPATVASGSASSIAITAVAPNAPQGERDRAPVAPRADLDRASGQKGGASVSTLGINAAPAGASASTADSAGDLVAELALLRDAHAALRDGDGARALALLADHARRFPAGALTEEREASRVLALCNVGRVDEARDAASRFLREHPRSPQAARVAHACDGDTTF